MKSKRHAYSLKLTAIGILSSALCLGLLAFGQARDTYSPTATGPPDYDLSWFTVDGGGVMFSTGGEFELSGTIGQPDAGMMTGGDFQLFGGFWFPVVAGDGNGDGVVDLVDYDVFEGCLAGPGGGAPDDQCSSFDTDGNGTVDLADFAAVQTAFTGP
jgi:hypothetical protein